MELCGNKGVLGRLNHQGISEIDLEAVGNIIQVVAISLESKQDCVGHFLLCDLTLYPSGKLLVKNRDKELAASVAKLHMKNGLLNCKVS